jgi:hypothetical protein
MDNKKLTSELNRVINKHLKAAHVERGNTRYFDKEIVTEELIANLDLIRAIHSLLDKQLMELSTPKKGKS